MDQDNTNMNSRLPRRDDQELFDVPEGYFDNLTDRIMDRVVRQKKNLIRTFFYRPIFMYAAAAAAIAIVLTTAGVFLFDQRSDVLDRLTVSITDENPYLSDFLLYDVNDSEFIELAGELAMNGEAVQSYDISDEEIINYLSEGEMEMYIIDK